LRTRLAAALALAALACACTSATGDAAGGRIMVVDARGAPLPGAFLVLIPEIDGPSSRHQAYTSSELKAQTADAQGMIHADLDDCLWESDHTYHFRVHLAGYEDATMSVSTELFPPVLRVEMRRLEAGGP
jgi:hypothetical protein